MRYTKYHEWVDLQGTIATIGLCPYARDEIGEIVNAVLPPEGARIEAGASIGAIESNKSALELYAPLSGKIESVTKNFHELKWLYKMAVSDIAEYDALLTKEQYEKGMQGGGEV